MKYKIIEKEKFNEVIADKGYVMTDWDKKDILTYTSSTYMATPKEFVMDNFYTVTDKQDLKYKEQQMAAYELKEKERRENERK